MRANLSGTGDSTPCKMVLGDQGLSEMGPIQQGAATRKDGLPAWQNTIGRWVQLAGDWMGGTSSDEIGAVHIFHQRLLPPIFYGHEKGTKLSMMSEENDGRKKIVQPEPRTCRANYNLLLPVFLLCDN